MSAEIIPFVPRDYDPRYWPGRGPKRREGEPSPEFMWALDALHGPCCEIDTAPSEMNPEGPA